MFSLFIWSNRSDGGLRTNWRFNWGLEDASGTDHVRCGEGDGWVFHPWLKGVVRGESGRNEFLRGPFSLFEAHSRAKFEKTSLSTDGLPCPRQNWFRLLPRGRFSPGTEDSGGGFRTPDMVRSGRWLSPTLNGEGLVADITCFRQTDIKPSAILSKGSIEYIVLPAHGSS